jgi:hypothetical protein
MLCPALPCPALPCPALPCHAMSCPARSRYSVPALPCPALPCPPSSVPTLLWVHLCVLHPMHVGLTEPIGQPGVGLGFVIFVLRLVPAFTNTCARGPSQRIGTSPAETQSGNAAPPAADVPHHCQICRSASLPDLPIAIIASFVAKCDDFALSDSLKMRL